jgi:hypothetical protein
MPTTMHFIPNPKMVRPIRSNYSDKEIDNGSDSETNTFLRSNRWKVSNLLIDMMNLSLEIIKPIALIMNIISTF